MTHKISAAQQPIDKKGRFWRFGINEFGRDFIVPDIHGELAALLRAMDEVNFDSTCDRLFSVGDLVDRGPDSYGVLELIKEPWFHPVMGNHDQMMAILSQTALRPLAQAEEMADRSPGGVIQTPILDDESRGIVSIMDAQWVERTLEELRSWHADSALAPPVEEGVIVDPVETLHLLMSPLDDAQWPLAIEVGTPEGPVGIVHADPPNRDWIMVETLLGADNVPGFLIEETVWGRGDLLRFRRGCSPDEVGCRGLVHLYSGHSVVGPGTLTVGNRSWIDEGAVFGKARLRLHEIVGTGKARPFAGNTINTGSKGNTTSIRVVK